MAFSIQPLTYKEDAINGISAKAMSIHHDKLYAGYIAKRNEIAETLKGLEQKDFDSANQAYSMYRGLSEGETFAANGSILHEVFFGSLGGDGNPGETGIGKALVAKYGSWEKFVTVLTAKSMSARGWAVLAYDSSDGNIRVFIGDAHNQGGVWGAVPLFAMDVYEHAYFMDFGSDRKAYIAAILQAIDWKKVDERYKKAIR
jgi:superoxide dismutase, Fe-Mn family